MDRIPGPCSNILPSDLCNAGTCTSHTSGIQNASFYPMAWKFSHLQALEAESIHILREVTAEFQRPVMLYSVGKDSSVMLRLAQKAFHPGPIPFPLLHVDTSYKFKEMIEFRDQTAKELGLRLIVHSNQQALDNRANPLLLGTERCCGLLKTQALLDALRSSSFDAAFGGARRDELRTRRQAMRKGQASSDAKLRKNPAARLRKEPRNANPAPGPT